jgi:hypothetical protein
MGRLVGVVAEDVDHALAKDAPQAVKYLIGIPADRAVVSG